MESIDSNNKEFNTCINELIKMLELQSRNESELAIIDRLKKRISLSRSVDSYSIISISAPWFIEYSDRILADEAEREQFFLNLNPRKVYIETYKQNPPPDDEFMFSLADIIKIHYNKANKDLKAQLYQKVLSLHNCAIIYQIEKTKGEK